MKIKATYPTGTTEIVDYVDFALDVLESYGADEEVVRYALWLAGRNETAANDLIEFFTGNRDLEQLFYDTACDLEEGESYEVLP